MSNKVLLYSTWNYIQYPVINHNEKNMKKYIIYFDICIRQLKQFAIKQKLTQHVKSTILQ